MDTNIYPRGKKLIGYQILTETDHNRLSTLVESAIKNGWLPYGSLSYGLNSAAHRYSQAMIKYEQK